VAPAPVYAQPAPAYPQPAYAAGYPQPAYPGYPPPGAVVPQGGGNKTVMMIGIAAVGVLLLGAVLFLALKGSSNSNGSSEAPQVAVNTQPATPAPKPVEPPAAATPTNTVPPPAPNPQGTPPTSAVVAAAGTEPVANVGTPPAATAATPPAVAPPTPPPAAVEPKPTEQPRTEQPSRVAEREPSRTTTKPRIKDDSVATTSKPSTKPPADDGLDDDFDSLFGKPKPPQRTGSNTNSTPTPYIPPEPGGGQESLAQSDIMAVVLNNKPAIVKCVNEQKKRDPGISGKLVMRWVIQTSGKTTSVSVRTDEFKKTYMASCITGLIKGWTFPKHKKQGDPIDFPFTF